MDNQAQSPGRLTLLKLRGNSVLTSLLLQKDSMQLEPYGIFDIEVPVPSWPSQELR